VEDKLLGPDHHGVAGVMAALETNDQIRFGSQEVDDLPLPFVSPLRSDNHHRRHCDLIAPESK
jgi:hypothetical protein